MWLRGLETGLVYTLSGGCLSLRLASLTPLSLTLLSLNIQMPSIRDFS